MEFIVTVTMKSTAADADSLLDAYLSTRPAASPVVAENLETSTLDISFSVHAASLQEAGPEAAIVIAEGAATAGISDDQVLSLHIETVTDNRQAQLA